MHVLCLIDYAWRAGSGQPPARRPLSRQCLPVLRHPKYSTVQQGNRVQSNVKNKNRFISLDKKTRFETLNLKEGVCHGIMTFNT